ncbi:MAG: transcription-repair coupling factor, partial [Oscillospiraceae bacterium]
EPTALRLCEDLRAFLPELPVLYYPAKELMLHEAEASSGEYEFARLGVLEALRHDRPVVVASAEAAMQATISPDALSRRSLLLKGSFSEGPEGLIARLLAAGYTRCEQVDGVCTFAVRGGILDLYSPSAPEPVRVEFWGDDID